MNLPQTDFNRGYPQTPTNPPALNIPAILTVFLALLFVIHAVRDWLLTTSMNGEAILALSFIPARYTNEALAAIYPFAAYWTPFSYALLHGDWAHLIMNTVWMTAFGAVIAKRFSNMGFIVFCLATALGGALAHYLVHTGEMVPVIGASAIVSGAMGAASRFAFGRGLAREDLSFCRALSLIETFQNRQVLLFLAIWFAFNFLFGSGLIPLLGDGRAIAWEAHVGGFMVGLLGFSIFDRI